jgi:hypothetical protein
MYSWSTRAKLPEEHQIYSKFMRPSIYHFPSRYRSTYTLFSIISKPNRRKLMWFLQSTTSIAYNKLNLFFDLGTSLINVLPALREGIIYQLGLTRSIVKRINVLELTCRKRPWRFLTFHSAKISALLWRTNMFSTIFKNTPNDSISCNTYGYVISIAEWTKYEWV